MSRQACCLAFVILASTACGDRGDPASIVAISSQSLASGHDADPREPGRFAAGFSYFVVTDDSRTDDIGGVRQIPVHFWYPVDRTSLRRHSPEAVYPVDPVYAPGQTVTSTEVEAYGIDRAYQDPQPSRHGPFPLVVLSPGWGHDPVFYVFYATRLASHGFVVAGLTHQGDGNLMIGGNVPASKVIYDRPRDMSFVTTELLARSRHHRDVLHGLIDRHAIAAMGHSMGGYAALVLGAGDDDACDAAALLGELSGGPWCQPALTDARIRAVVRLDASEWALSFSELARLTVPTLMLTETPEAYGPVCPGYPVRGHVAVSSSINLRADVIRSNHQSFTRLCDWLDLYARKGFIDATTVANWSAWFCSDPNPGNGGYPLLDPRVGNALSTEMVIAFLKTYLVGDHHYARYLEPWWVQANEPGLGLFEGEIGGDQHFGPDTCAYWTMDPPGWSNEFDYYSQMPRASHHH